MRKYTTNSRWYNVFSLLFCLALGVMSVNAQTSSGAGDWNSITANAPWPSGTLPATGATVTISTAVTVNNVVANSGFVITITSGGSLTFGSGGVLDAATIIVNSGGTLSMASGGIINLSGTFTNNGTYTTGSGVLNSIYFNDNYNRTSTTSPTVSAGGSPSVTYTTSTSGTSPTIQLTGTLLSMSGNPATDYASAPFPTNPSYVIAPFNTTLANNPGMVTWYGTISPRKSTAPLSGGNVFSQIIAATSGTFSTGNGYVVSIVPGSTTNNIVFGYYTGGLTTANFTSLITLSNVCGAQDYVNIKVTYNPYTEIWTLTASNCSSHTTNAGASSEVDPTLTAAVATGSSSADTKYTGSSMTSFGFQEISASTNTNYWDNYYIVTTPVVNVTSTSSVTAPVTQLSSLSGFTYNTAVSSGPSTSQSFFVNSAAISTPVTITAPTNYEVCATSGGTYASSLTITPSSGAISPGSTANVFVRLKSGLTAGGSPYNGTLTITSSAGSQSISLAGTVTNGYTVTYLGNGNTGGSVPTDPSSPYASGSTVTVLGNTGSLLNTGYVFYGWNTAANGSGTTYTAGSTFSITSNVTLYALWYATVTYNGNSNTSGTVPTDPNNSTGYAPGATVTVQSNSGSLGYTDYTFGGWNTAANGSGITYAATGSATFTIGSTAVTLYALWEPTAQAAGDWNTFSTWGTSASPSSNTTVVISKAITVNGAAPNSGFNIVIQSGGSLTFGPGGSLSAASVSIQSGGSLVMSNGGTLTITGGSGAFTNGGSFTAGLGTVAFSGITTLPAGQTFNILSIAGTGTTTLPSSGTTTVANINIASGATLVSQSGGTLTVSGSLITIGTLNATAGGTITVNGQTLATGSGKTYTGNYTLTSSGYGSQSTVANIYSGSTWTKTANYVTANVWSGGGGGGSTSTSSYSRGAAGGQGGNFISWTNTTPLSSSSYSISIGSGGVGGVAAGSASGAGGVGGTSSINFSDISATLTATGGTPGSACNGNNQSSVPGGVSGGVYGISVVSADYTSAPTSISIGGTATGAFSTSGTTPTITIAYVGVTNQGGGYTSAPTVTTNGGTVNTGSTSYTVSFNANNTSGPSGATIYTGGAGGNGVGASGGDLAGAGGGAPSGAAGAAASGATAGGNGALGIPSEVCAATSGTAATLSTVGNSCLLVGGGGAGAIGEGMNGGAGGPGAISLIYNSIAVSNGSGYNSSTYTLTTDIVQPSSPLSTATTYFNVTGTNLTNAMSVSFVSGGSNFVISTSSTVGSSNTATIGTSGTQYSTLSGTIYVALSSAAAGSVGTKTGVIKVTCSDANGNTTTVLVNVTGVVSPPPPTNLKVASTSDNHQYLTWTAPSDGSNVIVIGYSSNPGSTYPQPSNPATSYTANSAFGSGSSDGNGGYVVYYGTGTNVEVSNLSIGTYYYQVIAYNGSYSVNSTASAATAVQPITSLAATLGSANQASLTWTNPATSYPSGHQSDFFDDVLIVAYPSNLTAPSAPSSTPSYSGNAAYGSGTAVGNGYAVYYGSGSTSTGLTVTNLTEFTNYIFVSYTWHNSTSTWSAASTTANITPLPSYTLNTGDFMSIASGYWNNYTTWAVWNGTAFVAATSGQTPGSTNNVYIANNSNVTNTYSAGTSPADNASYYVASSSGTYPNCNNLYVIQGSVVGTNASSVSGVSDAIFVSGTAIQVGTYGTIGNSNIGNTYNGISFYILNTGTTVVGNYGSQTGGSVNVSKLQLFGTGSTSVSPTLEIARNVGVHYHGSTNGGGAYGLAMLNTSTYTWTPNGTITIDNGATVTIDAWSCVGPYIATTDVYPVNFTLNVNGNLTFTAGLPSGTSVNQTYYPNSNNGFLSMGSTIAYAGTPGTGCYLNIGSTGHLTVPEFYPNNSNNISSASRSAGTGRTIGINIDGTLEVGSIADFSVAGGQTVTGSGHFVFDGTNTYIPTPTIYLGSASGLTAVLPSGSNTLDGTNTTYAYYIPSAWEAAAYVVGNQVTANGNVYTVTTAGTAASPAPSGSGANAGGTAAFTLVGSAAQTTGSALPSSVYGLSFSNSAGVTLSSACSVTNNYSQTGTVVSAASTSAVLTLGSLISFSNYSSTNYVAGPLKLYSTATTSPQTLVFPIASGSGSSSDYVPVTLGFSQGTASATAYQVTPKLGSSGHSSFSGGAVSTSRYYTVTASGNTITNGSITLNYDPTDETGISTGEKTNLVIAESVSNSAWVNEGSAGGTGGSADGTGTISSPSTLTSFGDFAIAEGTVSATPPTLTAASNANVGAEYSILITASGSSWDATWVNSISSVTYNGTALSGSGSTPDYTITHTSGNTGYLNIFPNHGNSILHTAGIATIIVKATTGTSYEPADVQQTVTPGSAYQLGISVAPVPSTTTDGAVLTTQPVILVEDLYGNAVTSSTATITASVGSGSNSGFSLGGVLTADADGTDGKATFASITATNKTTANLTGQSITFTSGSLLPVTASSLTIQKPTTYYWVGGTAPSTGAWPSGINTTGLWSTTAPGGGTSGSAIASFTPSSTDIYVIDGFYPNANQTSALTSSSITLKYSINESIGQLIIRNKATVSLSATTSTTSTIVINGDNAGSSGDLSIDGTSSLITNANASSALTFGAGATMQVASGGSFEEDEGTLSFASGGGAYIGGAFTSTGTGVAVNFAAGTFLTIASGGSVTQSNGTFSFAANSLATTVATVNGTLNASSGTMSFGSYDGITVGSTGIFETGNSGYVTIASNATAAINGIVNLGAGGGSGGSMIAVTPGSIQFNNGSICTIDVNSSLYPFGSSTSSPVAGFGSVVFNNGSALTLTKGADIFGGENVVNLAPTTPSTSRFSCAVSTQPLDGHKFGHLYATGTWTPTGGSNGFSCDSLVVSAGTFTIAETGTSAATISNSIQLTGGTLTFAPASTATVTLNGSSSQTITVTSGTLSTLPSTLTLNLSNANGLTLGTATNLTSSGTISLASGNLTVGANTLSFNNLTGTGSLITSSASSLTYTGTGTFNLPSSITALNALNNGSGTMTINAALSLSGPLANAGTLSLGSNNLSVGVGNSTSGGANLTNNGTITGSGYIIMNASNYEQVAGTGTIENLNINPASSHTVAISAGSSQNLTGVLLVGTNGALSVVGSLTLKSTSIPNSAVVGQVSGSIATSGSGTITVERYIPAGYRAYRDLCAAGIYASGNTLYNTWQESGSYSHSGYGLFITGATSTAGSSYSSNHVDNGTGGTYLDYSLNSYPSASYWNTTNQAWSTVTNTNTTALNPFQSYRVLVRGDRGFDLYTTPIINYPNGLRMYDATTLRTTGSLIYGNVTYTPSGVANSVTGSAYTSSAYGLSSASNGYTYIANPYDCPIDFHNIFSNSRITNMIDGYWYLDPTIGATGSYVAYNAVANVTNTGYANGNLIQAGQGFLVANYNSTSPSLEITEADKVASSSKTYVFGAEAPTSKLFVGLLKESTRVDGVAVVFGNNFSNGIGLEDSRKIASGSDNLSILEGNDNLSIDGRLPATSKDVLSLRIGQPSTTSYLLRIDASGYINEGYSPFLYDAYKNTTSSIEGIDSFSITLDTAISASYANRFSIIFTPSALAVNSIVASATLNDKVATITWSTVGEKGESYYSVEKSTDGKNFTAIGQQAAKNTAIASYTATDNSVVEGNNYYRIKAVSETGSVNYSNVAKVQLTVNSNQFTVYPNPLVGKTLNVSLGNVAAGKYVVCIYNVLGEKVNEQTISHSGGSATHAITINNTLAGGVYSLVIRESGSNQIIYQSNLSVQP